MKTLFIFLAVVMFGSVAKAQKFNSYPNTGTLQTGDLFIFSRGGNGTFNINALQLPGALGVQPTNSNLTDFAKWGTNSFFNVASNKTVSGLGTAAFTATTAYDAAGLATAATNGYPWGALYDAANAALNSTNGIGIASSLSAFRPTNTFDAAGAATAATNALVINATAGNSPLATTNQLIPVSATAVPVTNQYAYFNGDNGKTNVGSTTDGKYWTNLVSWMHEGTTTNITAAFNGTLQTFTVTNGPTVFFHYSGANGSISYRIYSTNFTTLAFDFQPKWLAGSNNVITNGVLSLTSYGGTNTSTPAQLEAAMRENQ